MVIYAYISYSANQVMQHRFAQILSLHILTVFAVCLFTCNFSYAQESDFLYEDGLVDERPKDATVLLPDEYFVEKDRVDRKTPKSKVEKSKPANQEQKSEIAPVAGPPSNDTGKNELAGHEVIAAPEDTDSPLSFNFLYYIIQKFKFSDIVDE